LITCNFNLFQFIFISPNITHYKFASEGFPICTHTTSLTFDLPSDQKQLPKNKNKLFHKEKREEPFMRATEEDPSPGWTDAIDVM